jgi:hypothetical protein
MWLGVLLLSAVIISSVRIAIEKHSLKLLLLAPIIDFTIFVVYNIAWDCGKFYKQDNGYELHPLEDLLGINRFLCVASERCKYDYFRESMSNKTRQMASFSNLSIANFTHVLNY